jgi:hypothetical protein
MNRHAVPMLALCLLALCARSAARAQCTAPAGWFPHAKTPEPTFTVQNPPCGFQQWAWQTFLWATQPTGDGRIRLLDLPTGTDLFLPGKKPEAFAALATRKPKPLFLTPRVRKQAAPTSFAEIHQAFSRGVLVDANGHPLYYATHVNEDFYTFVRTNNLFTRAGYDAFPKDGTFPTKALELKSSWRVLGKDETGTGFFTIDAIINPLACKGGMATCQGKDILVDATRREKVKVALVGLHVVGVVEGHPEFVWATFEHAKNAPDLPPTVQPGASDPVSDQDFTFYKAKTPAKACNVLNGDDLMLDVKAQTLSPVTGIFRRFANGNADKANVAAIGELNKSVHDQLDKTEVWQNYNLIGSVWFRPGAKLLPGDSGPAILAKTTGSVELSNATMETFTQAPPLHKKGCFACHDAGPPPDSDLPAKNINLSHILINGIVQRQQAAKALARPSTLPARLNSFKEVQDLLDNFVKTNNVPIQFARHKDFWKTMDYDKFTSGNVPNVKGPDGKPLKILVRKSSAQSNLILALQGAKGTIFDPDTGLIGRMPPDGPFMSPDQIKLLADWIDQDCPNPKR